jgi:hypothetical protein
MLFFEQFCLIIYKNHILKKIIILLLFTVPLLAQRKNQSFVYHIDKASSEVKIDGLLTEPAWQTADSTTSFHMILPYDTSAAQLPTVVRMCFDKKYIYIAAVNYMPHGHYTVESLRRDWNFLRNDSFIFAMDTFGDQTNGFAFGVNSKGAQWDGQQFEGGSVNTNWDNKWYSKVTQNANSWTFEAAIPFKSIRYNKNLNEWGVNFGRNDLYSTEKSAWAPVPRQFPSISSAYLGVLAWNSPPPALSSNISVIPYFLGGSTNDIEGKKDKKLRRDFGADAKVAITSSLNLDLTINPDFSQVEVDRQQTNLDRFELFFPERRQFFLENADLFNNLGTDRIRPFFSRRIGLGVPISYGARVSGKLNNNLRIGAMNIRTQEVTESNTLGQNFTVATLQQKVFARSYVTGFYIDKNAIGSSAYNRNMGLEYNLATPNDFWKAKLMVFKGYSPTITKNNNTYAGQIQYHDSRWNMIFQYEKVDKDYTAEVGYLQRTGYSRISPRIFYSFYPKTGPILFHGPGVFNQTLFKSGLNALENTSVINYQFETRSRAHLTVFVANDYIKLTNDFDPTNLTGIKVKAGSSHYWNATGLFFNSKPQALLTHNFESRLGGYYAGGSRLRLAHNIGYRLQPYMALNIAAEYNDINLPESQGFKDAKFWLISPRLDLTFTNNLYFTTFYQYNQQINNSNINARLQWRYKPASDLFLVFTDNYNTQNQQLRNRAIILKLNYWWNV